MSPTAIRTQTYANHRALPPLPYLLAGIVLLVEVGRRLWIGIAFFIQDVEHEYQFSNSLTRMRDRRYAEFWSFWDVLVCVALLVVWYASRRRAQIVQDRVIRLELRIRLERLLGSSRRADIEGLELAQLVGLRFASDAELPALVEEVLAGKLTEQKAIKLRVQNWVPDWLRV